MHKTMKGSSLLLILGIASLMSATAVAEEDSLPSVDCVLMLRKARIAELKEDFATQLKQLQLAEHTCHESVLSLTELLRYDHLHHLPKAESDRIHTALDERLRSAAETLPLARLRALAADPDAGASELEALLSSLEKTTAEAERPNVRMLRLQSELEVRTGDPASARQTIERILAVAPTEELRWEGLTLDQMLGNWERVVTTLRGLIDEDDSLAPEIHLMLIEALAHLGRVDETLQEAQTLVAAEQGANGQWAAIIVHELLPVAYSVYDSDPAAAERLWRQLRKLDPDNAVVRRTIAWLFADDDEREELLAEDGPQSDRNDVDSYSLLEMGAQRLAAGDFEAAIEPLEKAVKLDPDLEAAWYNLGLAGVQLKRWGLVERAMKEALRINPNRSESVFQRGIALFHLERCSEAVPVLERALTMDATRYQSWYFLWRCYNDLHEPAKADEAYANYKASAPEAPATAQ